MLQMVVQMFGMNLLKPLSDFKVELKDFIFLNSRCGGIEGCKVFGNRESPKVKEVDLVKGEKKV